MKKIVLCLTAAAVWVACAAAQAQSNPLLGSWHCQRWGASMTLGDGSKYTFRGPTGASAGVFAARGGMLRMRDSSGTIVTYNIRKLTATSLVLADQRGQLLAFTRVAGKPATPAVVTPVPVVGAGSVAKGKELARKDGQVLTTGAIDVGVGIIQFVVDRRIKKREIKKLTRASIKEFNAAPVKFNQQVASLAQSLARLRSLQNALHIGAARQLLLAAFHKATHKMKKKQKPLMIRVINKYVKVLAYDETNNLVLTKQDVAAALKYMQLSYELAGQKFKITSKLKKAFKKSTLAAFPTMSLEQKKFFCSANVAYKLIVANWDRLKGARRDQLKAAYAQRQQQAAQARAASGGGGYGIKYPPGWSTMSKKQKRKLLRKKMRNNTARQNMFRMMQNSATQHHATMLNTIENFGGSGNYWKVVPGY